MQAATTLDRTALRTQLDSVQIAAAKLIERLSARAAYANKEEFDEIRALIASLRGLGGI